MTIRRRSILMAALSSGIAAPLAGRVSAAAPAAVRVGDLRFGTVSWELDTIHRHGFDTAAGVKVEAVPFAASQATQVALQAGRVDVTVQDFFWVSRQRSSGADWTMVPFSTAIGAVVAPPSSPVRQIRDLRGHRLGVAGSPLDKSWLILRAYAQKVLQLDLEGAVEKTFAAPPLLSEELQQGRIDAALTFWPFAAKAEAAGMRRVLAIEDAIQALGVAAGVPMTGYVFSEKWAGANHASIQGFLAATAAAHDLLARSDSEWETLRPLTGAANDAELRKLRDYYRHGIPRRQSQADQESAAKLYQILAAIGGSELVGSASSLAPGTFWQTQT
jgi:NitT/TauT family transport system substrate-binding protein